MHNTTDISLPAWDYEIPPSFLPYFFFETMDFTQWRHWLAQNWKFPFYASTIYIIVVFTMQNFMKSRTPLKLQRTLVLWNVGLSTFSILGFVRLAPEFLKILFSPGGFHRSVCSRDGLNFPAAAWALLFGFSKYVELGDTVFIVLRKQRLIFLHWYHHCAALVLASMVIPYGEPIQRYYGFMNYAVHSLMYVYYVLKAMKIYVPRRVSMMITSLQLLQMIIAVGVNVYTFYIMHIGQPCARDPRSIKWVFVIYGSFLWLFADFMYKSYFCMGKKSKKL